MDQQRRQHRHHRIRQRVRGSLTRPRVSVYRSLRYIDAQLINDETGVTLAASHGRSFAKAASKIEQAYLVGKALAKSAQAAGVTRVAFDRSGYKYHGRIEAVAKGLREGGIIL